MRNKYLAVWPMVKLGVTLAACALSVITQAVDKSPNDLREYKQLELDNQLQVLLISDPNTRKAAASVSVDSGSGDDPRNRQGLAHFLEHMLFLGTEKYPEPDAYQAFISAHAGSHNAYTSFNETNYFFDVDAQHLQAALDRFAQFFVAPLFNEEYVAREIHAVDSEYRSRLKDDARRSLDVFRQVINPKHPFTGLSVGNVATLTGVGTPDAPALGGEALAQAYKGLRESLLLFYKQHYSANQMTLVVMGKEDLATLEKWARAGFSSVKNSKSKDVEIKEPLFEKNSLPKIVSIQPEKNTRSLGFTFALPDMSSYYRSKPTEFVGNIIGHEGEGSLLSYLKAKGWAESLSSGQGLSYNGGSTFNVSISLTELGLKHVDDISLALFQIIERIRTEGIQRWMHDEQKNIFDTALRFQEKVPPISYVSRIASNLHRYPMDKVLVAPYTLDKYKPRLLKKVLKALTPQNSLLTIMAPSKDYKLTSPWYFTPYSVSTPTSEQVNRWTTAQANDEITLPKPNPFLAKKFVQAKKLGEQSKPVLVVDDAKTRMWWAQDQRFSTPKTQQFFRFSSSLTNDSARHAVLTALLVDVLNDKLNEFAYPALLAGLHFQIGQSKLGLTVGLSGYSDKQELLLERISATLSEKKFDVSRVETLQSELLRRLGNAKKRLPYKQLFSAVSETLINGQWSEKALSKALVDVSVTDLLAHRDALFASARLDAFVFGSKNRDDAEKQLLLMSALLDDKAQNDLPMSVKVVELPEQQMLGRELIIDHSDAALLHYFQAENGSDKSRALYALTTQALKADFFQELRTEQQLGYIVFATSLQLHKLPGLAFLVQAPQHSAAHVYEAIQKFLAEFSERDDLTQAWFEQHKAALISNITEPPKNLSEQAQRFWAALALDDFNFSRRQGLLKAVNDLTLDEWKAFYQSKLVSASGQQMLLWSDGQQGTKPVAAHLLKIENAQLFKASQELNDANSAKREK